MRNLELPGRSPVHGIHGMVATSHTLSSMTAVSILMRGGNAMDAAIAACAVQCVVEPESTGIGGDCFCIYSEEGSDDLIAFNGSGRAPMAATAEWYIAQGIREIKQQSPHSVTVPAALDAWCQLNRDYGKLDLGEVLEPAINYANNGYPISSRVSVDFSMAKPLLEKDPNLSHVFIPDGKIPGVGEMHRQPRLARTLQMVADNGREAFYTGDLAQDMVDYLQSLGGLHTMEDFSKSIGNYVKPISTEFRGHTVWECPPNGQGIIALLLLNIMSGFKTDGIDPNSAERLHQEIEAGRLAYQDRNVFVADPAGAEVPIEFLLSQAHAEDLRSHIDQNKGMDPLPPVSLPKHEDTVYITVVDKDRNACSFINTLFHNFGAGLMAPKSGVTFTNRTQGFVIEPGHRNCIAPGKRPMHTIIPGMVSKDGKVVMPFGVMGGHYQAFGHMQFLTKFFDFDKDIQEAQDMPRIFPLTGSRQVEVEGTVPQDTIEELRKLGHEPVRPAKPIGGSQAIWIDWDQGILTGGSEPRKDGCALGY